MQQIQSHTVHEWIRNIVVWCTQKYPQPMATPASSRKSYVDCRICVEYADHYTGRTTGLQRSLIIFRNLLKYAQNEGADTFNNGSLLVRRSISASWNVSVGFLSWIPGRRIWRVSGAPSRGAVQRSKSPILQRSNHCSETCTILIGDM